MAGQVEEEALLIVALQVAARAQAAKEMRAVAILDRFMRLLAAAAARGPAEAQELRTLAAQVERG